MSASKPMVIPSPRPHARPLQSAPRPIRDSARQNVGAPLPPGLAELLAVTAIPPLKSRSVGHRSSASLPRKLSVERLRQEWARDTSTPSSLGKGSPLDFLLETADSEDSFLDDADREDCLPSRSVSSESIHSTPSLELDDTILSLPSSAPSTPTASVRRSPKPETRERLSSPPSEQCHHHPHLEPRTPALTDDPPPILTSTSPNRADKPRSTLKSNLTASLYALRSAAKAFSNFTAPSLPSDDFLTRSLFSSRYASEMRPRRFAGLPDPALRRYLNPTPALSTGDLHAMLTDAKWAAADVRPEEEAGGDALDPPAPMIPLTTYARGANGSPTVGALPRRSPRRTASSPPLLGSDDDGTEQKQQQRMEPPPAPTLVGRQREPRENGDFLRVIVLEMNMRRVGKLDARAAGRARVWLPPRKGGPPAPPGSAAGPGAGGGAGRRVPARWVGIAVDDL